MRLINADAFIEEARNRIDMQDAYLPIHIKYFVIDEMPTIEAEPVRHGEWVKTGQSFVEPNRFRNYSCSVCGYDIEKTKFNYCPYCGAKMEGVEE